jgi:hypothetical protein
MQFRGQKCSQTVETAARIFARLVQPVNLMLHNQLHSRTQYLSNLG